jgi:hypothetical protein
MAAEIIRITVLSVANGRMDYRNVVTRIPGSAVVGDFHLTAGTEALVELDNSGGRQVLLRVLEPALDLVTEAEVEVEVDDSEHPLVLINGEPLVNEDDDTPLVVGQIRRADFAFSSHSVAERDRGRTSKWRPCVVMELDGEHVSACPIHSLDTAARRAGGRRLKHWKAAGLTKPVVVSGAAQWFHRSEFGDLVGVLHTEDARRLGLSSLPE